MESLRGYSSSLGGRDALRAFQLNVERVRVKRIFTHNKRTRANGGVRKSETVPSFDS